MHLVSFIIRIYHDARSPERQMSATGFESPPVRVGLGRGKSPGFGPWHFYVRWEFCLCSGVEMYCQ